MNFFFAFHIESEVLNVILVSADRSPDHNFNRYCYS